MPRDIILLHMCTINEDHMIYGSWDIRHNEELFGSYNHMLYSSWDVAHDRIISHFGLFFALSPT